MEEQNTCTCDLKYKICGLEQQIVDLEDQIDDYKQNLDNAQYENTKLSTKVDEQATELKNLEKELEEKHGKELLKLQTLIKDLKADKIKLKKEVESNLAILKELKADKTKLQKDVEKNLAILKDVHISMTRFDARQLVQDCQVMLGETSTSSKVGEQNKCTLIV